jgi:hypothetical protein
VEDVLLPRNRKSYNDMCAQPLSHLVIVQIDTWCFVRGLIQRVPLLLPLPAFCSCDLSPRYRHIVFELFDTDLNHMIRSETRYDMTHRRWVLYQVRNCSCTIMRVWVGSSCAKA